MEANSKQPLEVTVPIKSSDFQASGDGAARIKQVLQKIGFPPNIIRRVAIATYEAEMNMVIHSLGGEIKATISPDIVTIVARDYGPGIPDIDLAMQEGYSTAPREILEMGFGAGMGLPNICRCADRMTVVSPPGQGTTITIKIYNRS
jgi:anti-sigma regulatory factor (Ser/Thr protein kinase)